jgi:NitT/TauT family transport system substrate-binding protein
MRAVLMAILMWTAPFYGIAYAQKQLTPIKIAYAAPTVDNVLIAIADSRGLFEKHGIKAELVGMRGGVLVMQGVLAGSADFGQAGGSETVQAILSGMDVVMIAGLIPRMHYLLVTRPDISRPADLEAKKFAVASLAGTVTIVARRSLQALGVTPGRVTFLVAGAPQDRLLAVASGNMDATIVQPESLAAVKKAGLKVLKDLSEIPEPIQLTTLLTTRKATRENRDLTKSFLAAIQDSIGFYRNRENETIEIIEKFTGVKDQEALRTSYRIHKSLFPLPPYPSKEGIQTLINQLSLDDPKAKGAVAENFFDSSLLEELKSK